MSNLTDFQRKTAGFLPEIELRFAEPMSKHTSFRIGGTGFGHTIATGVKEAVEQDGFLGVFTGGLKASAGGITAAICFGLVMSCVFKAKNKA